MSAMNVLHVEDSPGDARLLRETVDAGDHDIDLHLVSDGQAALDLVFGDGERATFAPDLILLDYHLPGRSGLEVLRELKSHSRLRRIPVVVLSDDDSTEAIETMYDAHANAYVPKPESLDGYERLVCCLPTFWGTVSELPPVEVSK